MMAGMAQTADSTFVPGLEGIVAFETEIAEPDKDGGTLRYRGVDITDLVGDVSFGNVWGLLVDNRFNPGLPPAEPFPLPVHTCLLYTSDAADDLLCVDLGGR